MANNTADWEDLWRILKDFDGLLVACLVSKLQDV